MTEDEARAWLRDRLNVSRETFDQLETFIAYLKREAQSQNLIAASTLDHIWARHIVDSAQLLALLPADKQDGSGQKWLDLGSGAGFPGIISGLLSSYHVTLVESRARRIEYLQRAVAMLDLDKNVRVAGMDLARLETEKYEVISARAFAPLPRLLEGAARFSTENSIWLLPKGRNAAREYDEAKQHWALDFQLVPSVTDADAGILTGKLNK
jgi:16S rRNA (guanine527-N7)-methyltransferase